MKRGYVKSSPHFFRPVKISMLLLVAALAGLAWLIPAPLQEQADIARVPNPVKSAWFLLWIQELVSYSKYLIYLVLALTPLFLFLPWLATGTPAAKASWFPREHRLVAMVALALGAAVLALTVVAMFLRGPNWQLAVPF